MPSFTLTTIPCTPLWHFIDIQSLPGLLCQLVWKQILHLKYLRFHTSELKRIWQTLQEMIGRFVFTIGGPKVCVITAFWTGSIWGQTTQRSHQRFSNTGGAWEGSASVFLTAVQWSWMREKGVKVKVQVNDRGIRLRGKKAGRLKRVKKSELKREQWLMWTGGCVFSQQQLVLLSVPDFLGAVQTL